MRCPKCGYITFDHVETCGKCHKDISAVSSKLTGTVMFAEPPGFLQFDVSAREPDVTVSTGGISDEESVETEVAFDADDSLEADDIQFDFEEDLDDAPGKAGLDKEQDFDLPLTDDEPMEIVMEGADEVEAEVEEKSQIDFSELDISDLAPPEEEIAVVAKETELTLESVGAGASAATAAIGAGSGLGDLQVDDMDLDVSVSAPAGSVTGVKLKPAVKTGTALDDFDFDLGDLISGKEE